MIWVDLFSLYLLPGLIIECAMLRLPMMMRAILETRRDLRRKGYPPTAILINCFIGTLVMAAMWPKTYRRDLLVLEHFEKRRRRR